MHKYTKVIIIIIALLFIMVGCDSNTRSVSTYDEKQEEIMKERYSELSQELLEKYPADAAAMSRNEDYDEYTQLNRRLGPGLSQHQFAEKEEIISPERLDSRNRLLHIRILL